MKKMLASLITVAILSQGLNATGKRDGFSHAIVGLGIYVGCFMVKGVGETMKYDMDYLTPTTCLIPVVVAGVSKELYDSQHDGHTAEFMDVVATIAIPMSLTFVVYEW